MKITTGFITGTGFYRLPGLEEIQQENIPTPFGEVQVEIGSWCEKPVAFIPRHGKQHHIPPGQINYQANLFAMHLLGVERILSTSVCGSLYPQWGPGSLILIDQFLNFTCGRKDTFFPRDGRLAHVDVTEPYCGTLHRQLREAAHIEGIRIEGSAVYACFEGPRFETRAEIEMVRRLGGQLVGMTNYPECVLARELEICYATVGVVSNLAAGAHSSLRAGDLSAALEPVIPLLIRLFSRLLQLLPERQDCTCRQALEGAFL